MDYEVTVHELLNDKVADGRRRGGRGGRLCKAKVRNLADAGRERATLASMRHDRASQPYPSMLLEEASPGIKEMEEQGHAQTSKFIP